MKTKRPILCVVAAGATLCGCLAAVQEPQVPTYRNPLDLIDAGARPSDGGVTDGGRSGRSVGTVEGRNPDLFSAIYSVELSDAGTGRTSIFIADVADLCAALASDGGLGLDWDVLRFRLAGDEVNAYPVASVLPPGGAVAEFDYQSDAGSFGTTPASGGNLQIDSIDPGNVQSAIGSYTLTFSGTDSLEGTFLATPCALVPPPPGA